MLIPAAVDYMPFRHAAVGVLTLVLALFPVVLASIFASNYAHLLAARWKVSWRGLPSLPPGTMGLPYWGETIEYMKSWNHPTNADLWYDVRQAKHGNTFKTCLLGSPTIVLLGPEANKFVLSNENKLFESSWPKSLRELEGRNAVSMVQGEAHRRLRRAVNTFLNTVAVRKFTSKMEEIVIRELKQGWDSYTDAIVHAFPALRRLAFRLNADLFMGLQPGRELDELQRHYDVFTKGLESQPLDLPWTVFGKAKKARKLLLQYIFRKIEGRRQEVAVAGSARYEARDLLDVLVMSKDEETGDLYSLEEIGDNMLLMVHAGQETTASALAVTLKHLSHSEEVLSRLKAECRALASSQNTGKDQLIEGRDQLKGIDLLRCVISEGLRMCPPVSGLFKRAKCDVIHEGFTIPKGWTVHLALRHTQLKPEFFSDPQTFDPSRFERRRGGYAYIPFGQGVRICPGMEFAKVTMELFLYHLVIRYDWQLVDPHEKIAVTTFAPHPEQGLPIRLTTCTSEKVSNVHPN